MNRRALLKTGGLAAVGALTIGTVACGKNISFYSATVIGALKDLRLLLPSLGDRLNNAISVAEAFDSAYRAGKFADAATLFENLTIIINEIIAAIGVMNESVKLAVAVGGVALRAIAVLLRQQASDPVVAARIQVLGDPGAKAMIQRMADPSVIDKVVEAVKP